MAYFSNIFIYDEFQEANVVLAISCVYRVIHNICPTFGQFSDYALFYIHFMLSCCHI